MMNQYSVPVFDERSSNIQDNAATSSEPLRTNQKPASFSTEPSRSFGSGAITLADIKQDSDLYLLSVKQIKYLLTLHRVDYSGDREKQELLNRLRLLLKDYNESKKDNEERASGSGIDTNRIRHFVGIDQRSFFLPGACTNCHKLPTADVRIMACSKCHLVWYCGKECQKKNWKYHKEFCKATSSVAADFQGAYLMDSYKLVVPHLMNFQDYLISLVNAVSHKLQRKMDDLEIKIVMTSKVCEICKVPNHAVLKPCKMCYMVFYCSENHNSEDSRRHSKVCPEYFLSFQCYHLVATKGMPLPGAMPFKVPVVSRYKPMSGTLKDYIKPTFHSNVDACLSEWVSYPFSLLYALEHTGLNDGTKKIGEVNELTVLMCDAFNSIVGTMEHCLTWEYMFHLLPELNELNVRLWEPYYDHDITFKTKEVDLCSECKSRNRKLTVTLIKNYFAYKWSDDYKNPDVILNHEIANGDGTVKYLTIPEPEVPVILLSANKDAIERSIQMMKTTQWEEVEKFDIILPLQMNPFRGMRPTKVPMYYMEDGSFLQYVHSYIFGFRRQCSKKYFARGLPGPSTMRYSWPGVYKSDEKDI